MGLNWTKPVAINETGSINIDSVMFVPQVVELVSHRRAHGLEIDVPKRFT